MSSVPRFLTRAWRTRPSLTVCPPPTPRRLAAITAASFFPIGGLLVFTGVSVLSGITSVRGVSKTGVYGDGKTLTVRGAPNPDGTYFLNFVEGFDQAVPASIRQAVGQAPPAGYPVNAGGPGAVPYYPASGPTGMPPATGVVQQGMPPTAGGEVRVYL